MIWTLHAKPAADGTLPPRETLAQDLIAVPDEHANWALFFPALWLVWHRLWLALIALLIVTFALLALLSTPYLWVTLAVFGLPGVYLWLEGNQLRRNRLDRRGYALLGVIEAGDEQTAVARYLAREPGLPTTMQADAAAPAQAPVTSGPTQRPDKSLPDRPPQRQPDTFGLFGA